MSGVRVDRAWRRLSQRSFRRVLQVSVALALVASLLLPGSALAGNDSSYTVRPGDSLGAIALYFDVSLDALMRANGIRNANHIYVGQVLRIPSKDAGAECVAYHTVGWGQTLSGIALWYGIDAWDLAEANGIYDLNAVYQGQRLCVPGHGSGGGWHADDDYKHTGTGGPDHSYGPSAGYDDRGHDDRGHDDRGYDDRGHDDRGHDDRGYGGPERPYDPPAGGYDGRDGRGPDRPYEPSGKPEEKGTGGPEHGYGPSSGYDGRGKDGSDRPYEPSGKPDNKGGGSDRPKDYAPGGQGGQYDDRGQGYPDPPRGHDADYREPDGRGGYDGPRDGKPHQPGGPVDYWKGSYYKDKYFTEFVEERRDPEIRFNWYTGKPGDNLPEDRFSVHWERWVYFKEGGYRFVAVADDGVRVILDEQTIIDGWKIQPATEYRSDIYLREGWYKVTVDYYEEAEDAQIHFYWEKKH